MLKPTLAAGIVTSLMFLTLSSNPSAGRERRTDFAAVQSGLRAVAFAGVHDQPDHDGIDRAVQKAKDYLIRSRAGTHWDHSTMIPEHSVGLTALCAIALVEAGIDCNHDIIRAATQYVRSSLPTLDRLGAPNNYAICLTILLLDRVCQDPQADTIVKNLALQVAAAQNQQYGGWSYNCPALKEADRDRWLNFLQQNESKVLGDDVLSRLGQSGLAGVDNSNTQFAIIGLYKGMHHGVPAAYPLRVAERRFRRTQGINGGWSYGAESGGPPEITASMTAAGLLALAIGFSAEQNVTIVRAAPKPDAGGAKDGPAVVPVPKDPQDLQKDPQVLAAQRYLVDTMTNGTPRSIGHFHYFLWSLERVCMMYGWEKDIRGFDWYTWGSNHLIKTQATDGSWEGDFHSGVTADTAFSLLFLVKSNLLGTLRTVVRAQNPQFGKPIAKPAKPAPGGAPQGPAPGFAKIDADAQVHAVLNRDGKLQQEALAKLRDTPGKEYSDGLLEAIQKSNGGALQNELRDALATRFAREDVKSLRGYLRSDDKELQTAAAWAAATKDPRCKEVIPDIIQLLSNTDDRVAAKAHEALTILSDGEDFGKSADKWNAWWDKVSKSRK